MIWTTFILSRFYQKDWVIEFAEAFSKKEKIQRVILYTLFGGLVVITHLKWVFPYIGWYADTAYCHTPFGYSGIMVLWYALFVGIPLFCAFLTAISSVPIGIKGLRDKQFPPKGCKVYKPTKIVKGWHAKAKSLGFVFAPLLFVAVAIWGSFQVDTLPNEPETFDYSVCDTAKIGHPPFESV